MISPTVRVIQYDRSTGTTNRTASASATQSVTRTATVQVTGPDASEETHSDSRCRTGTRARCSRCSSMPIVVSAAYSAAISGGASGTSSGGRGSGSSPRTAVARSVKYAITARGGRTAESTTATDASIAGVVAVSRLSSPP